MGRKHCQCVSVHHKSHMVCGRKELYNAGGLNYDLANDRCYLVHDRTIHINPLNPELNPICWHY